ncbi:MAG: biotin--[acetyl-CoA-carboxylase] ligase [Bacteroidota bacterium]
MIGETRIHLEVVDSTNRYARDLIPSQPLEGSLITAERQTAGRGRLDRKWLSAPAQNILASIILYPKREVEDWGGLPLLTGLGVCKAVRRVAGVDAHLKWPNDVLIENRKLCGILVETGRFGEMPWAVVGIGLNVNQLHFDDDYRLTPVSLALEAGRTFDTDEVLSAVCKELDQLYELWRVEGNPPILAEWRGATRMFGKTIVVEENGTKSERRAIDLAEDGALVTELPDGSVERLFAGDVLLPEEEE